MTGRTTRPLASAAWADPASVAARYPYRPGTIWLGRLPDGTPVGYGDDRHVCLVSATRGGKGTSSIVPNLCLWPGSIVVIDPKGENAAVTAPRRGSGSGDCEGMGQAVHVLDPFGEVKVDGALRSRFNPLDALDPDDERTIDEAARLADALVVVRDDAREPFWDESAREMVKALILHVITSDEFEGRRNLMTVKRLIMRGDAEAVELLREAGRKDVPSPHLQLWGNVKGNEAFGGVVADFGHSYANLLADDPKQYEGVKQSALRNLEFVDSPAMQRCMEASDFDLSELKTSDKGLSLYLCLPQRYLSTHYRWLRMMIALVISEMAIEPGLPACGHDVLLMLDEFAALERMKFIEKEVAQIAHYHVKLFFVLQTLEQIHATYKDNWQTLLGNCGLKIFFGLEDHFSREHVSKLIGETEVFRDVRSASDSTSETENHSESRSESTGETSSRGHTVSEGTSRSSGRSVGGSTGSSRPDEFRIFGNPQTQLSEGQNWGWSDNDGTNRGSSDSLTEGSSRTAGTTSGLSRGTSRGTTSGSSETVQARPLISPDEIGRLFGRIDDRRDPAFPGRALALFAGQPPVVVRRTNYFEDYQFLHLFGRHPGHRFTPAKLLPVGWDGLRPHVEYFRRFALNHVAGNGQIVAQGQRVLALQASGAPVHVIAPRSGRLTWTSVSGLAGRFGLNEVTSIDAATLPQGTMFALWHYDDGAAVADPFGEVAAARAAAEVVRRKKEEEGGRISRRAAGEIQRDINAATAILRKWWAVLALAALAASAVCWMALTRGQSGVGLSALAIGGAVVGAAVYKIRRIRKQLSSLRDPLSLFGFLSKSSRGR